MTSADLRAKLKCFICQNNYTDSVVLPCGDRFCQDCIDGVLDRQRRSGGYSCPKCSEKFQRRPAMQSNKLRTWRVQPYQKKSVVFRTHTEHVPTTSSQIRKCSTHNKCMTYYCIKDDICICTSCRWAGEHRGHQVETLDEASGKKKTKLRNAKQKLRKKKEEMEKRVQSLQEHRRKVEEKADGDTERVTDLFRDLRRRLEDLEKRVLKEISGRAERVSISIQDLEIKKEELTRKIRHIEELCNMTDPLTVLQESDTGDLCDTEDGDNEDRERHEELLHDGGGLDVAGVLHTGLSDIIREVNVYFYIQGAADILLDVNTAHNYLHISDDRKTISWSVGNQKRPETLKRFTDFPQVLGSRSFSSGQHYWEVDVGGSDLWKVGMCYPSMDRMGLQAGIGMNNKSWGLLRCDDQYSVRHDSIGTPLPTNISSNRVRIYLDYEDGRISFYDMCDPIQHLHTFTTTFTEPLHAALSVKGGCIKI
ncbi:E3 ubiquitin-protein ligase TRIM39-like [Aquarana catesbeiana]|uniref:E3 ubiquitin-protein ligase TRIM39-like n=1 Tax=Aquarana catesbeiana TaxID=8400 RepID=UPI003CC9A9E1